MNNEDNNKYIEATPIILEEQTIEVLQKTVKDVEATLASGGLGAEVFRDFLIEYRERCLELIKQRT